MGRDSNEEIIPNSKNILAKVAGRIEDPTDQPLLRGYFPLGSKKLEFLKKSYQFHFGHNSVNLAPNDLKIGVFDSSHFAI